METKICRVCKIVKNIEEFRTNTNLCKNCASNYDKEYREKNKEKKVAYFQRYYIEHKEEKQEYGKKYYEENKEYLQEENKKRYEDNKEKILEKQKIYYEENKKEIAEKTKIYAKNNEEKIKSYQKQYREEHKEELKEYFKDYNKIKRRDDIGFLIRSNVSSLIRITLKRNGSSKEGKSFIPYLSYSIEDFRAHIEDLFEPWMNWGNWGVYKKKDWDDNDLTTWKWSLDHIIPQSDFYYESIEEEEFKKCWALENLRPLNAKQNILDGSTRKRHKKRK
jgi:hypothetical protein